MDRLRFRCDKVVWEWLVIFLCLAGLSVVAGCGKETRAAVSGKVTVDGKPLTTKLVTILFAPDKDNPLKKIPSGTLDDDGVYRLDTGGSEGAPLGWYKAYLYYDAKPSKGEPPPFHPRYLDAMQSPFSIEVVANPQPGVYDLKLTVK
jgi:hypothetical protein